MGCLCDCGPGTLVLMHGGLVHMSYENKSDQSRQAYTLHVIEGPPHASYPADNWYRLPPLPGRRHHSWPSS
jgi:ectoine hydroxylase-related dioxygenase (phytanoyl-CoA dioxygenase family)